jgi:hypothetical protein
MVLVCACFAFTIRNAEVSQYFRAMQMREWGKGGSGLSEEREREGYDQDDIFVTLTVSVICFEKERERSLQSKKRKQKKNAVRRLVNALMGAMYSQSPCAWYVLLTRKMHKIKSIVGAPNS